MLALSYSKSCSLDERTFFTVFTACRFFKWHQRSLIMESRSQGSGVPKQYSPIHCPTVEGLPGDFARKVIQINSQSNFNLDVEFCRPFLPHSQILYLYHFNLRSLYFKKSLPSLTNSMHLHTSETSLVWTSFQ